MALSYTHALKGAVMSTKINYNQIKGAPVSVLIFGAKGDVTTDDTAALTPQA